MNISCGYILLLFVRFHLHIPTTIYILLILEGGWREWICLPVSVALSHYFSSQLTISAHPVCGLTTLIRLHWTEKTFYQIFASRLIIYRPNRSRGHTKVLLKEWRMWGTTFNKWVAELQTGKQIINIRRRRQETVVTCRDIAWHRVTSVTRCYPGLYLYSLLPRSPLLA